MMDNPSDASGKEPEVKYLVEALCETYQDGLAVWDARVSALLVGDGKQEQAAKELREILDDGSTVLGKAYTQYYRQAGRHFAIGDDEIQTKLAHLLHILSVGVVEVLQLAHADAISGIPCMPSSFHQYQPINFPLLQQRSSKVHAASLSALQDLFDKISAWAIPLHTLPPLASPPTTASTPEIEQDEGFFGRLRSPFHRQRYVYKKLPSQYSIRLVRVNAARPYVMCDIETFHLADPPPFQALSYCWGKGGQHADIWCNERLFKVSTNLRKGLQRLYKLESRVKWFCKLEFCYLGACGGDECDDLLTLLMLGIDQICINQNDFAERTGM